MNFSRARLEAAEILNLLSFGSDSSGAFEVRRLSNSAIRLGCGNRGLVVIIDEMMSTGINPINLQNIIVRPNLECEVKSDGVLRRENVTVIELVGSEQEFREDFLTFSAVLASADVNEQNDFQILIEGLVELLRQQSGDSRTSAVGLWGELFTIFSSTRPNELIAAWHAIPSARHDFTSNGINIEVKTSTSGRRHNFSANQLSPDQADQTIIISLLTELNEAGMNIGELVDEILNLDGISAENRMHLQNMARKSLGDKWGVASRLKFSITLAESSKRIFRAVSIPQVLERPVGVSEIQFVSDLEFAESLQPSDLETLVGIHRFVVIPK